MSAAATMGWRPVYDAGETLEQFAARQRQAFAAFEVAWREGRVSLKLKGYYDQVVRDVGANAYAWWTEERWAAAFRVSVSTIKRVLRALTTAGLIRRERQFGSSSRTFLTSYDRGAGSLPDEDRGNTDNQHHHTLPTTPLLSQHDIRIIFGEQNTLPSTPNQNPEASQEVVEPDDYRQQHAPFFGSRSAPTIGSVVRCDPVKTRHLTIGAAGVQLPVAEADPLARQVIEHEGVADFVLAPRLAQQAAGELQAVSRYLDTQTSVRDRPRLFAWLATHGFGRQLLAGRSICAPARRRRQAPPGRTPAAPPILRPPEPPSTAQAAVWQQVCDQLGPAATLPADVALWLPDTVLLDLTATAAVIGTPNVFVRDALQAQAAVLAAALSQIAGRRVEVTVVVDGCA